MLQRAASNAYSWWWAGHIRTKQSKWLEQSMQDMEEKVECALRLIQEDGDSFARRAEMYYKKRPELISFVEEAYRAFRALAERYDSLSTDLQKANTTIATCLPEQVQFAMDDEDDFISSKHPPFNHSKQGPPTNLPKVPKVPDRPMKGIITDASRKLEAKKPSKPEYSKKQPAKSGLTKSEALEEIDKLQKDILALQTMKEYVKSSYESGISKYWGLENEIMEKQDKVSRLQDEFSVSTVIDDQDARTLMAEAAIKSCQETLAQLQDKQEKSAEEAKVENEKIEDVRLRLNALKHEFFPDQITDVERADKNLDHSVEDLQSLNKEVVGPEEQEQSLKKEVVGPEGQKLESLLEKIKEQLKEGSNGSLTVSELADKIDNLVNMVINLETSVLSQTVLIDRLRTEADELHSQIRSLEDDKANLLDGTHDLESRVKEMEEKLSAVQNLNLNVVIQNTDLKTHFAEVHCSLDQLSEKIYSVKPDEETMETDTLNDEEGGFIIEAKPQATSTKGSESEMKSITSGKEEKVGSELSADSTQNIAEDGNSGTDEKAGGSEQNSGASLVISNNSGEAEKTDTSQVTSNPSGTEEKSGLSASPNENQKGEGTESTGTYEASQVSKQETNESLSVEQKNLEKFEDDLNWQQMLLNGLEDKERILLAEYTTILRNYKDVKKKLSEEEKKNETLFETTLQLRDMKSAVVKRDQEIQSLRQKINLLQAEYGNLPEADDSAEHEAFSTPPTEEEEEEIKFLINQPKTISPIEEKLRGRIDAILEENLDFWLRFSGAFHQVQKFQTEVHDLQDEITQLKKKKDEKKHEGKSHASIPTELKADARAVYKHLSEKRTELTVWLEQSELLKDELQSRISSISDIQEAITVSLKEGVEEDEITFSTHQAAKFQGEVLNMKQENNKVREELLAGIDHIMALRIEIEKTLAKLNEDFKLTESKSSFRSNSRSRIPLRSFLFGIKMKRHKHHSFFSYMHSSKKTSSP